MPGGKRNELSECISLEDMNWIGEIVISRNPGKTSSFLVAPVITGTCSKSPIWKSTVGSSTRNWSWPKSRSITGVNGIIGLLSAKSYIRCQLMANSTASTYQANTEVIINLSPLVILPNILFVGIRPCAQYRPLCSWTNALAVWPNPVGHRVR